MARVTLSRIYELSRYLATPAGKELQDPLTYLSELAELTLRNLRNGLTFADNLASESKTLTLRHGTEQVIAIASKKRPQRIYVDRVIDPTYYVLDGFGWKFATNGDTIVKANFAGSPPSTLDIRVDIVIFFG